MSRPTSTITLSLVFIIIIWNSAIMLSNSIREAAKIGTINDPLNIWWWLGICLIVYALGYIEYQLKTEKSAF